MKTAFTTMKTAFTSRLPYSNDPKTDRNKVFDAIHGINYILWDLNRALDASYPGYGNGPYGERETLRELRREAHMTKDNLEALRDYLSRASDVQ